MASPRYHVALGQRSPRQRRLKTAAPPEHLDRWEQYLRAVLADCAHLRLLPLPIDGLVLVDSRSTEDASHEVRLQGRHVLRCTGLCGMHPACFHRAAAGLTSYLSEMADASLEVETDWLATLPTALLYRLVREYLSPLRPRARFGPRDGGDSLPITETRLTETP